MRRAWIAIDRDAAYLRPFIHRVSRRNLSPRNSTERGLEADQFEREASKGHPDTPADEPEGCRAAAVGRLRCCVGPRRYGSTITK